MCRVSLSLVCCVWSRVWTVFSVTDCVDLCRSPRHHPLTKLGTTACLGARLLTAAALTLARPPRTVVCARMASSSDANKRGATSDEPIDLGSTDEDEPRDATSAPSLPVRKQARMSLPAGASELRGVKVPPG